MIGHLLESTLLLAMALLIAPMPRLAARTRYAVVFAGLMTFAIPSAAVPGLLSRIGIDLTRMPKGTILIDALGPLTSTNLPATRAPIWPLIAITFWLAIAAAFAARAAVRGREGVRLALWGALDADARELVVLARACTRAGVTGTVRLVQSPSITTPVTFGVLRSVIAIPAGTQLSGTELETILTHECAHIARRDSFLGIVESIAGCVLWFHPLVWIARRVLDAAREEACDAVVIASGDASVYVTALGKVCGAAIAPRAAGISCIVSNTIRERMDAIMRFGTRRLLPHRAVMSTVFAFLAVTTLGVGAAHGLAPTSDDTASSPYKVEVTATRMEDSSFAFVINVHIRADGRLLQSARVRSLVEQWATARGGINDASGDHEVITMAKGHADGTATVEIVIDGTKTVRTIVSKPAGAKSDKDKISLNLKDADVRDVLRTFSQLANTQIVADDDVSGRVTISAYDIPWQEAFARILDDTNLRQERVGDTIRVHRK
ncbi:MAG TPA: M56 family metallopeptidase [Thermoanaerobaculia bacterium]|nr:M56 family metallopeptidase [Thermoanaerobaculia bacterium]